MNGSLLSARIGHTATLLDDGRVLVVGGDAAGTSEIYDPAANTSIFTGSLSVARSGQTATRLHRFVFPDDRSESLRFFSERDAFRLAQFDRTCYVYSDARSHLQPA